jgi:hypothetical protein
MLCDLTCMWSHSRVEYIGTRREVWDRKKGWCRPNNAKLCGMKMSRSLLYHMRATISNSVSSHGNLLAKAVAFSYV